MHDFISSMLCVRTMMSWVILEEMILDFYSEKWIATQSD